MLVPLESSLLAWVRYDSVRSRLLIQFRDGERYLYFQLPPVCYQQLLQADSKGAYFNRNIRNRFPYQHLSSSPTPLVLASFKKTK
jgi:hypothetical protein